jgi:hypothetical protein
MYSNPTGLSSKPHLVAAYSRRTRLPLTVTKAMTSGDIWSHCGIVVPDPERNGELVVVEALMFKGVVKTPIEEWKNRYPFYDFVAIECPRPEAGVKFALDQVGSGYDYLGMIGAPWRTDWDDPHRWYCSELLEACVKAAGLQRFRNGKRGIRPMETFLVTHIILEETLMSYGQILPGSSGHNILLILDNKVVGVAKHAVSCNEWCGVQVISGELHDQLAALDTAKVLSPKYIYPRFSPYTGMYLGTSMTDVPDVDALFENVRAVNEFELNFGMVPEFFKDVEGYKKSLLPQDEVQ